MKNSQNTGHTLFSAFKFAPFCALAVILLSVFASCKFPSADFSEYQGVNLIPSKQFGVAAASPDSGWTPDEAALSAYTSAVNMWYEPVSSAAGLNESGDSFAGYGDEASLRNGLPALADGSVAPIFRLETKNLFINGDLEAGDFAGGATEVTGLLGTRRLIVDSSTPVDANDATKALGAPYVMQGKWSQLNFSDAGRSLAIPFAGNVVDHTAATARSYSISFKYIIDFEPNKYIALDDASGGVPSAGGTSPNAVAFAIQNNPTNTEHRFPFAVFADDPINESSILTTTANELQYLIFNPQPGPPSHLNNGSITVGGLKGSVDDFELVRSALPNGIRISIPWAEAGRPDLQRGGTYTVKFWVRSDRTSNYSGTGNAVANRFAADFVSVSLHPYVTSSGETGTIGDTVTLSRNMGQRAIVEGWTDYALAAWDSWTEIQASFTGRLVLGNESKLGTALQLVLSATNMGNPSLRSPGSILISNPQLYWSEN